MGLGPKQGLGVIEPTIMEGLQDRQNTARSKDETAEMVTEVTTAKQSADSGGG